MSPKSSISRLLAKLKIRRPKTIHGHKADPDEESPRAPEPHRRRYPRATQCGHRLPIGFEGSARCSRCEKYLIRLHCEEREISIGNACEAIAQELNSLCSYSAHRLTGMLDCFECARCVAKLDEFEDIWRQIDERFAQSIESHERQVKARLTRHIRNWERKWGKPFGSERMGFPVMRSTGLLSRNFYCVLRVDDSEEEDG